MRVVKIKSFDKGLVTQLEPQSIPEQAASASLNWLTLGDRTELSGGYTIIGTENTGAGKITGLSTPQKVDGSRLPIRTRGKKVEYYNVSDWVESGTDVLGTDADGEDIAITPYTSLSGYQAFISSPNSSFFKMMLANPSDIKDIYNEAKNFKGYIKAINSSIYLWYRANNKNYLYRSYKDAQDSATDGTAKYRIIGSRDEIGTVTVSIASPGVFTRVSHGLDINDTVTLTTTGALPTGLAVNTIYYVVSTNFTNDTFCLSTTQGGAAINTSGSQSGDHTLHMAQVYIGAAGSTTYSGTLAEVTGRKTCFNVVFTDGTTTITDDKNGGFTGGTGTINYATGAYSVTFPSVTVGPVTVSYETDDSTSGGVADFSFTSPTRGATEGFFLPQPTGGDLLAVMPYQSSLYCLHENNAWVTTISTDDVTVENIEWRDNLGMKNWRAAVSTGDGIYYIDTRDELKPRFRLLTLQSVSGTTSSNVVPVEFSYNVDLSGYDFSEGIGFQWQDYILFSGRTSGSSYNNRVFAYNKVWKSFDILEYATTCFAEYEGALWAGDALSNNVMKLFSTTAANQSIVNNYWIGKLTKLEVEELKKFKRLTLRGFIGRSQTIKVSLSFDNGNFVEVGRVVGTGDYVNYTGDGTIGSSMVGSDEIGGGGSGATGYEYIREFNSELRDVMQKFDEVRIKIEAIDVGYASFSEISYYDVKTYGQKNLLRYRKT
jgi:hypothetical protein